VIEIVNKGLNHLNGVYGGVTRHNIMVVVVVISSAAVGLMTGVEAAALIELYRT
jgi:hypothetical protein